MQYIDKEGAKRIIQKAKEYTDNKIGDINTILDEINGEVV